MESKDIKTSQQKKKENSKQNLLNLGRGMEVAVNPLRRPRARRTSRAIPSLFLLHTNTRKRKSLKLFSAGAQCLVLDNCLRGLTTVHSASPPLPVTPKAARCRTRLARAAACPVLVHKHTHDRHSMQKSEVSQRTKNTRKVKGGRVEIVKARLFAVPLLPPHAETKSAITNRTTSRLKKK